MVRETPCAQDESALTDADRKRITEAVMAAEARTAGEIVVVIETEPCEERDVAVALIIAGFLAILAAGPLSLLNLRLESIVIGQAAIFAALAALAAAPRVRAALRLDRLPASAARRAAERAFLELKLGRTKERTGVLIHVALAERHVEVIADQGVHTAVAPETWRETVMAIVAAAKQGRLADGIVAAVERCGDALADVLPPQPGLGDELPNEPVTR
ncbi:putative membrane protein [Hansschlegelia beijingensis]|uniref:Putative membrane protein n=2 Tax=Hansschlegelia beijingensis TaxID=1133344 RepID=A0A7W6GFK3_9HYPH|nr:putative membrane protein [Hansschlegelia beijingensis]